MELIQLPLLQSEKVVRRSRKIVFPMAEMRFASDAASAPVPGKLNTTSV
jgi:hypothetical protein